MNLSFSLKHIQRPKAEHNGLHQNKGQPTSRRLHLHHRPHSPQHKERTSPGEASQERLRYFVHSRSVIHLKGRFEAAIVLIRSSLDDLIDDGDLVYKV